MDPKLEKWRRWLDRIKEELIMLLWSVSIYQDWQETVASNPEISGNNRFWDWLRKNYVESALMAIRRQIDGGSNAFSLLNLVKDIEANSALVNRKFFKSLYPSELQELAEEQFDGLVGSESDHYPQESAKRDRSSLEELSNVVKSYIDRRLAHADGRPPENIGTLDDLHEGIKTLEQLLNRYRLLLKSESGPLIPIVEYDWKAISKVPWIKLD